MSEHSPGPWRWVQSTAGRIVWRLVSATGRAVFWPVPDRDAPSIHEMGSTDINCPNEADRALLAAAPELLQALREMVDLADDGGDVGRGNIEQALALIARIESP